MDENYWNSEEVINRDRRLMWAKEEKINQLEREEEEEGEE